MLIDANRVLDSLISEFDKLSKRLDDSNTDGSAAQGIASGLLLLRNREQGSIRFVRSQFDALLTRLQEAETLLATHYPPAVAAIETLALRCDQAQKLTGLDELEEAWRQLVADLQALIAELNSPGKLATGLRAQLSGILCAWESADLLEQARPLETGPDNARGAVHIDRDNLQAYLVDRLNDPGVSVKSVSPLAGGFGKETILFDFDSTTLRGSFVMRRDMAQDTGVNNDCHRVEHEYPVIKAVFDQGFPAPDALWLDTDHALLPGGHFIVMRRSPGTMVGNFFGARSQIPDDLADTLAETMARLHGLPPLRVVGDLTESICGDSWQLEQGECTRRYIQNWYDLYRNGDHHPSPAIISLYGWLLDNIPKRSGPPVLLHGDFGFHNFLFHNDALNAVLDWEFAHVGDPAEELGYVKVTVGGALDWDRLLDRYLASGGQSVDTQTLKYFEIWAYVRNASGASLLSNCFNSGLSNDLKLTVLPYGHIPQFIRGAQALIDQY
jgi:aminoglycoside phosphotransferase (APT) family kinase protein